MKLHEFIFVFIGNCMFDVYKPNEQVPFECINTLNVLLYIDNPKRKFWEDIDVDNCEYIDKSETELMNILFKKLLVFNVIY